jgi:hypothetical protein
MTYTNSNSPGIQPLIYEVDRCFYVLVFLGRMKRRANVSTVWSKELAYVIGLIAADGNLSPDGRHINITSKDKELVVCVKKLLNLQNKIGRKARGQLKEKKYYVLQFGDINFYEFLNDLGLTRAKSKTISEVAVPDRLFIHFLRGCIDGDGNICSFKHPESKNLQIRLRLASASPVFLNWVLLKTRKLLNISGGYIYFQKSKGVSMLNFVTADASKILNALYHDKTAPALERKRKTAFRLLKGRVVKLVYTPRLGRGPARVGSSSLPSPTEYVTN